MNEFERAESVEGDREREKVGGKRLHYSKVDTSDETDYDSNIVCEIYLSYLPKYLLKKNSLVSSSSQPHPDL